MRPSAIVLLLLLCAQFLASESKLRQQAAVDDDDDDDDDDLDEDDDDDDDDDPKLEVDDDGRIYKNPRNSPSAQCPRDEEQAELIGQKCLRKCSTDEDCKSKKKKCRCDGVCGMSCIKPERECPPLSDIEHGAMTVTGRFFGDRAHYACDTDYYTVGLSERTCRADGHWTGTTPSCKKDSSTFCSQPPKVQNAHHNALPEQTTFDLNNTVEYFCNHGYVTTGMKKAKCLLMQGAASWYGPDITCKPQSCETPPGIPNGWHAGTGMGVSIIFRCKDHMKLVGNTSSVCQKDGKWRYPLPQCLAPCVVPQIENGQVVVASHDRDHINNVTVVEHGERLLVTCIQNYEFAANSTPVLCNNGTWSIVPSCSPARCKQMPKVPKNGMVIAPKTDHGMRAIFKCKDGFELVGGGPLNASTSVECRYGNWIGDIPHCVQVFCPFPGFIPNGKVFLVGNMGVYDYRPYVKKIVNNKQIMYDCDKGYVLDDGPSGATCIGGSWSPKELPKCILGQHPRIRWSRRRRSVDDDDDDATPNYKKFIEFFRKVGKKLLHMEMNRSREHAKHKMEAKLAITINHQNNSNAAAWKPHANHGNKSRLREERMIDFLKMVYRKLQRMDARQPNNSSNNNTMHDLLNAMSKNFFHVDLAESRRNGSRGRSDFEIRNQREFIKLKREFERIMRFYNKSIRWNEKQNRKDAKRKGLSHAEKRKDKKKHRKNYYKGFYEFVNSYVTEKLSMLEARNATEELIKKMNIDKFTVRNGTTFTIGEMYAFFKHIIENRLNMTNEESVAVAESSSTTVATPKVTEPRDNQSTTVSTSEVSALDNEIPAKEGAPKHRSKRIRNASEDTGGAPRQKRRLLSLKPAQSESIDDAKSKQFTFDELQAQQQSRSKRFLPLSELDNQIFLKNLYLTAYEDEYRANVKRSIGPINHTADWFTTRRRKGNLDTYEIK
ncbi:uncharacterized protein LOC105281865 isoform X2 [Ooceraea biroi]|uniref:uncharacterized protein LOC105281865 isoform X2 n=1 Tax=Ooceraea biroi TaxID=2015173 RepID=UPI0005BB22AE|nr:uncharacterized protein LOC105281865 isoform X2 [Ooceraea biroi]